jgi:hypothetical protein
MKLLIIAENFELEIRPTTRASTDAVKNFIQSLMDGDRRGPGRPKKGSNAEVATDLQAHGPTSLDEDMVHESNS